VLQRAAADLAERAQALQGRQEPPVPHPWEGLDRRSQQLLTRLRARVAAGQEPADQFKPTELEEWFAVSSTTAQDWLRQWQEQGLLEPARPGQRIRTWRLREPWQQWVLGQPLQRE
jgi:DNA-binding FadR family transcriptional regulator